MSSSRLGDFAIRPVRYRDLPSLKSLFSHAFTAEYERRGVELTSQFGRWQQVYPLVRALALFPNPYQYALNLHVAENFSEKLRLGDSEHHQMGRSANADPDSAISPSENVRLGEASTIAGFIQTSPGNQSRSRWNIDYLAVAPPFRGRGVAKALLDHVFQTYSHGGVCGYTLSVDVRNQAGLGLCKQNGFRQYATVGYYQAAPSLVGSTEPVAPPEGLRPMRPKDAQALAALYEASTPAGVRLIDSRSPADFELGLVERTLQVWRRQMRECEDMRYVLEGPNGHQIAYLRILGQYRGATPHTLQITVHPGYADDVGILLQFALGRLRSFPSSAVLTWAMDYHPHKKLAFESAGLQLVTEDICLVKDAIQMLRVPTQPVKSDEVPALKPAYCEVNASGSAAAEAPK